MKRILTILLSILFIIACSNQEYKSVEKFPDGSIKKECTFSDAEKKNPIREISFHQNGKKESEIFYKKGKKHGTCTHYYDNGQLWSKTVFNKGIREGETYVFFSNGQMRYSGQYVLDQKIGIWKFYAEDGKFVTQINYAN